MYVRFAKRLSAKKTTGWSGVEFRVNEQNESCGEKFKRGNEITHVSVSLLRFWRATWRAFYEIRDSRFETSLFAISPLGIKEDKGTMRP